jgi:Holliday junction DNA helicase RuvB
MSRKRVSAPSEPRRAPEDTTLDQTLRPSAWNDYVGQSSTKKNLQILLAAARERKHTPEHLLFYGPPGLGKTTLAHLIAHELGAQMKTTSGPAIEKVGDLAAILTNLNHGDIFFIDEIHRLNKNVEEVLYPAMETGSLDIIIGKGPSARTIQLDLAPFTLIAATTRVASLSAPLRSRFSGGVFRLSFYSDEEIQTILKRSAQILKVSGDTGAFIEIARRSRNTPRTANYLLKRCRDFAQVHKQKLTADTVRGAMDLLEVDDRGLTSADRRFLDVLITHFGGGPVGLGTIAAATAEEPATIEDVYEPYLMQLGFIERTSRGRCATVHAYAHLNKEARTQKQEGLL